MFNQILPINGKFNLSIAIFFCNFAPENNKQ